MIKYIVKEESKVVVAIIDDCALDAVQKILKRMPRTDYNEDDTKLFNKLDLEEAIMPKKFTAVVKCHEEDVFDEATGKKIAAKRVKEKYHNCLKRTVNNWVEKQRKKLNNIEMK